MDNKKTFKFRNIQGTVNGQYERTAPLFSRRAENYNETLRDVAAREQKQAFIELVKPPPESTDEKVKRIASEIDASLSSLGLFSVFSIVTNSFISEIFSVFCWKIH